MKQGGINYLFIFKFKDMKKDLKKNLKKVAEKLTESQMATIKGGSQGVSTFDLVL